MKWESVRVHVSEKKSFFKYCKVIQKLLRYTETVIFDKWFIEVSVILTNIVKKKITHKQYLKKKRKNIL